MAHPEVSDVGEEGLRIWRVAANILNELRIVEKEWPSILSIGREADKSFP
jgi:hypothetical protein